MIIAWLQVIGGLVLLVFGADRFVIGAAQTARIFGVPPLIIGITIVGIATSAPEILVGSVAALADKTNIAIGNAIGSNIANIALVLGGAVMIKPILIQSGSLRREYFVMLAATVITLGLMIDKHLGRPDALIMLVVLAASLFWLIFKARNTSVNEPLIAEMDSDIPAPTSTTKSVLILIAGLVVLLAGAEILLWGAVDIAQSFGLSDLVIGLTIVAIGTSLPELAACITSVIKNEADIAIGNIIGSNLFNMLAVLGVPVLINPANFGAEVVSRDFLIMLVLTLSMGAMIFLRKKINRLDGGFLLLCFAGYQTWLFARVTG